MAIKLFIPYVSYRGILAQLERELAVDLAMIAVKMWLVAALMRNYLDDFL